MGVFFPRSIYRAVIAAVTDGRLPDFDRLVCTDGIKFFIIFF
jgi:hypothetical protein